MINLKITDEIYLMAISNCLKSMYNSGCSLVVIHDTIKDLYKRNIISLSDRDYLLAFIDLM